MVIKRINLPVVYTIFSINEPSRNKFVFVNVGKSRRYQQNQNIKYNKLPSTLEELRAVSHRLVVSKKEGDSYNLGELKVICRNFGLTCTNKRYAVEQLNKLIR